MDRPTKRNKTSLKPQKQTEREANMTCIPTIKWQVNAIIQMNIHTRV